MQLKGSYKHTVEKLYEILDSKKNGLTTKEAKARLRKYGYNELKGKGRISPFKILLEQFRSPLVLVLIAAAIVSFLIGYNIDALVITAILVVNAVLGFIQEYKAEKAIEALKKLAARKAKVLRDNSLKEIETKYLVPGDVIELVSGDIIPADARIIECFDFEAQEASLTGESRPVRKEAVVLKKILPTADLKNMVFSGTEVTKGKCMALIVNTGMATELGRIAKLVAEVKPKPTPLQKKLGVLGKWISYFVIAVCIIVFLTHYLMGGDPTETFITAVALAVAAIPEGLPAVVTISLALGVQRMLRKNALVRKLPSVETLGSTTIICSDKTGTLTVNQMTVRKLFVNNQIVDVAGEGYSTKGKFSSDPKKFGLLLRIGALCNDAKLLGKKIIGDPTEASLLVSAAKAGLIKEKLDDKFPRVDEIPFSSERKRMTTIHKIDGKKFAYTKGATEVLLKICNKIYVDGKIKMLTAKEKKRILDMNDEFARNALRVLAFAYKEVEDKSVEKNLVFVGLQGMMDPPREEVKDAIQKCKKAGIKVVMITGDHLLTANAVAKEIGIEGKSLEGIELEKIMNLSEIVEDVSIYARVNPAHKLKIIEALYKKGHIIAMTGDGVNDAPALKKADIGIAMGITGTDVTKESSAMVLMDDNFASIVNAVEEGRGIYDNIKKFVNYLLSCNLGEVLVIFLASLMWLKLPLIAVQLLWINLITDGLPALALGLDPAGSDVMRRKPRSPKEGIISKNMALNVMIIGVLVCIGTLFLFWKNLDFGIEKARTVAFTTIVMLEIVRLQMVRSGYKVGVFSNKWLILAVLSSILLQLAVIYTPLGGLFRTVPLALADWIYIGMVVAVLFAIGSFLSFIVGRITKQND